MHYIWRNKRINDEKNVGNDHSAVYFMACKMHQRSLVHQRRSHNTYEETNNSNMVSVRIPYPYEYHAVLRMRNALQIYGAEINNSGNCTNNYKVKDVLFNINTCHYDKDIQI